MKKCVFIIMFICCSNAFACFCTQEINDATDKVKDEIVGSIDSRSAEAGTLVGVVSSSNAVLLSENSMLKRIVELQKTSVKNKKELIFELKRKVKML